MSKNLISMKREELLVVMSVALTAACTDYIEALARQDSQMKSKTMTILGFLKKLSITYDLNREMDAIVDSVQRAKEEAFAEFRAGTH